MFMKTMLLLILALWSTMAVGQTEEGQVDSLNQNPNYDAMLAAKLKADDYGMKTYFLVILKSGTSTEKDPAIIGQHFRGHMNNINKLVEEGKMIVAGPLDKNELSYRGIFILDNVSSLEEAESLLNTDPAIAHDLLDYEIFSWYGSAALPEYLPSSDKIWKIKP